MPPGPAQSLLVPVVLPVVPVVLGGGLLGDGKSLADLREVLLVGRHDLGRLGGQGEDDRSAVAGGVSSAPRRRAAGRHRRHRVVVVVVGGGGGDGGDGGGGDLVVVVDAVGRRRRRRRRRDGDGDGGREVPAAPPAAAVAPVGADVAHALDVDSLVLLLLRCVLNWCSALSLSLLSSVVCSVVERFVQILRTPKRVE